MFEFSDKHIEEYETQGFTVFRNIVPPKLLEELRRECARGVEQARQRNGVNTQRFQPVGAYDLDMKPFEEFENLPEIRDAVSRIVPGPWKAAGVDLLGVLLEPAENAWCTQWHRDWRDNVPGLDPMYWTSHMSDRKLFNQVNCALYEDSCTWVVPGSHLREDVDDEIRRFPSRPIHGPNLEGKSEAEREYECLRYCESMPGAKRLFLDAGDYCLYRNSLWHLGNYIPYRRRATLHDSIMTPEFRNWWDTAPKLASQRIAEGLGGENPNEERVAELGLLTA